MKTMTEREARGQAAFHAYQDSLGGAPTRAPVQGRQGDWAGLPEREREAFMAAAQAAHQFQGPVQLGLVLPTATPDAATSQLGLPPLPTATKDWQRALDPMADVPRKTCPGGNFCPQWNCSLAHPVKD